VLSWFLRERCKGGFYFLFMAAHSVVNTEGGQFLGVVYMPPFISLLQLGEREEVQFNVFLCPAHLRLYA